MKKFSKENSFLWNVGTFFMLISLFMMFTSEEIKDIKKIFEGLRT